MIAPSLYNDQQRPTTTIAKSEFSNFASKKRSQAALGNINQAYIALACTDIASKKRKVPFTGQNEPPSDYTAS